MSRRVLLCLVLLVFAAATVFGAEVSEYQAIRNARPDGRVIKVENAALDRDAFHFQFRSGAFHLLAPVNGRTIGAVFVGDGSYELTPASESERRHLGMVTGDRALRTLSDSFDSLVLLFSDKTAEELQKLGTLQTASPDSGALRIYEDYLKRQKSRYQVNLHLRVLEDLLDGRPASEGVFLAPVDGKKFAPGLIAIDPTGIGNLAAAFAFLGGEEVGFLSLDDQNGGFWYLCGRKGDPSNGRGKALPQHGDAEHYAIDTTIASNLKIEGTTVIRFTPTFAGMRVLPLHILPKLRIRDATVTNAGGPPVAAGIIQEEVDRGAFGRLFHDEVADADAAVVFPAPLAKGQSAELTIHYEGSDVLNASGESYSVGARESWYPNLGTFTDTATFDLTFRSPKRNIVVATGKLVSDDTVNNQRVTVWKSTVPMRVAGFNYGQFEKITRTDEPTGLTIDVYTQRDFHKLAGDTMADAMNAARVGTAFFGREPFSPVSITQQAEWSFGQSWPSLIYLPPIALITSTQRVAMAEQIGPRISDVNEFAKTVGWHEFAHQWWGHEVGWQSYRDQWLSEGFAEFTASVVLQFTENFGAYNAFWERRRHDILDKGPSGIPGSDAGPISDGIRLYTRSTPSAPQNIIYSKGAYVVHMLRMLMRDAASSNPDETFMAVMHEFVQTFSGKSPSSEDFQRVVEKHTNAAMQAGTEDMSYFFRQWVYGTEVPRLKSDLTAEKLPDGKFRIHGTVTQSDVGDGFRTAVPMYVDFGKDNFARLGSIVLVGNEVKPLDVAVNLTQTPRKVTINLFHDVLVRD